jgi:hypothetical protein
MSQGRKATLAGQRFENVIRSILTNNSVSYIPQYTLCKNIYGHPHRVDFFITNQPKFPKGLVIQAKWQDSGGSVDEKFPFEVMNVRERYPCPAIFIVEGGGQKEGSLSWLRKQVDGKLIAVMDIKEFMSASNRGLFTQEIPFSTQAMLP